ncbi:MAG: 5-oxoprolinase subunit PxpB, partial [Bacteroidota bacterium]
GYNTLLLQYDRNIDFESKEKRLLKLYTTLKIDQPIQFNTWHIPVCYDDEFGMDLPLFEDRGLSRDDVVRLHTSARYRIFMIGFLPGFLYLGGLPKLLHLERKDKPRTHVSKGSVAIGGEQTGIYPTSSPGGWQIIGRTPLTLFDISLQKPTPIRQGDQLYFYEIDKITYKILSSHKEKSETQKV